MLNFKQNIAALTTKTFNLNFVFLKLLITLSLLRIARFFTTSTRSKNHSSNFQKNKNTNFSLCASVCLWKTLKCVRRDVRSILCTRWPLSANWFKPRILAGFAYLLIIFLEFFFCFFSFSSSFFSSSAQHRAHGATAACRQI